MQMSDLRHSVFPTSFILKRYFIARMVRTTLHESDGYWYTTGTCADGVGQLAQASVPGDGKGKTPGPGCRLFTPIDFKRSKCLRTSKITNRRDLLVKTPSLMVKVLKVQSHHA